MNSTNGPSSCRRSARSRNLSESSETSCFGSDTRSVSSFNARHLRCSVDSNGGIPTDNSPDRIKRKKRRKNENECNSEESKKTIKGPNAKLSSQGNLEEELIRIKLQDNRIPVVYLTRLHNDSYLQPKVEEKEKEKETLEGCKQLSGVTIPTKVDAKILKLDPVIKINKKQTEDFIEVNKKRSSRRPTIEANEYEQVQDCNGSTVDVEDNGLDKLAERLTEKLNSCLSSNDKSTKNTIVSNRDKRLPRNFISKDINDRLPESSLKSTFSSTLSLIPEESVSENQLQSCKRIESSHRKVKCSSVAEGDDKSCLNLVGDKPKSIAQNVHEEHSENHNRNVKKYSKNSIKGNEKHSEVINKTNKNYPDVPFVNDEENRQSSVNEISNKQQEIVCDKSNKKVSKSLIVNNLRPKRNLASKKKDQNSDYVTDNSSESVSEHHSKNISIKLLKNVHIDSKLSTDSSKIAHKVGNKNTNCIKKAKESNSNLVENSTEERKKCLNKLNKTNECSKSETENNVKVIDNLDDKRNSLNFIQNVSEECHMLPDNSEKNSESCIKNQSERSKRSTRTIDNKSNKLSENVLDNNKDSNKQDKGSVDQSHNVNKDSQKCSKNLSQSYKKLRRNSEIPIHSVERSSEDDDKLKNVSKESAQAAIEEKSKKNSKGFHNKVKVVSDKSTLSSMKDKNENLSKSYDDKLNKIPKIPIENNEELIQNFLHKSNEKIVETLIENKLDSTQSLIEKDNNKQVNVNLNGKNLENVKEMHHRSKRNQINKSNDKIVQTVTQSNIHQDKEKELDNFDKETKNISKDIKSNVDNTQRLKRKLAKKINESVQDISNKSILTNKDDSVKHKEKLPESLNKNINDNSTNQNDVGKRRTRLADKRMDSAEISEESTPLTKESSNINEVTTPQINVVKRVTRKTSLDIIEKSLGNLNNANLNIRKTSPENCKTIISEKSIPIINETTIKLLDNKTVQKKPFQVKEKNDEIVTENKIIEKIPVNTPTCHLSSSKILVEESKKEHAETIRDSSQASIENKIITRNSVLHQNDNMFSQASLKNHKHVSKDIIEDKMTTRSSTPEKYQRPTENNKKKNDENISDKNQKIVKECSKRQAENYKRVTRKSSPDKHERLAKNLASSNNDLSSNTIEDEKQNEIQVSEKNQKGIKESCTVQDENCRKTIKKSSNNKCEEQIEIAVNISNCVETSVQNNEHFDISQKTVNENSKPKTESKLKYFRKKSINKHDINSTAVNNLDSIQSSVEANAISEKLDNKENSKAQVEIKTRITRNSHLKKEKETKNLIKNNLDCGKAVSEEMEHLNSENLITNVKISDVCADKNLRKNSVNKINESFPQNIETSISIQNNIEENNQKKLDSDNLNIQCLSNQKELDTTQISKKKDLSNSNGSNKRITRNMYEKLSENVNKEISDDMINVSELNKNKKILESSDVNNKTDNISLTEVTVNEYTKDINTANFTDSLIDKSSKKDLSNNLNVIEERIEIDKDIERNSLDKVNTNELIDLKKTAGICSKKLTANITSENQLKKCTEDVFKDKNTDNVNIDYNRCELLDNINKDSSIISNKTNKAPRLSADEVDKIFNENLFIDTAKVKDNKIQGGCENGTEDLEENLNESYKETDKISNETFSHFLNTNNDSLNGMLNKSNNAALSENFVEHVYENGAHIPNFLDDDDDKNPDYDLLVKQHEIPVQNNYNNVTITEDNANNIELSASNLITDNLSSGIDDSHHHIDESIANAVEEYFVNNIDETCNTTPLGENPSNAALLVDLFMDQEAYAKHRRKITLMELKKKCTENLDKKTLGSEKSATGNLPSSFDLLEDSIPTYDNNLNNHTATGFSSDSCVENATEAEDTSISDHESEQNLAYRLLQMHRRKTPPTNSIDSLDSGIQISSTPEKKDHSVDKIVLKYSRTPSFDLSADFECKYCSDCFVSNRELKKHVKFQHRQRLVMKITKTDSNEHVTEMLEPAASLKNKEDGAAQEDGISTMDNEKSIMEALTNDQITDGEIKIIVKKESGSKNSHVVKEIKITPRSSDGGSSSRSDYSGGSSFRMPRYSPMALDLNGGNGPLTPSFSPAKFEAIQPLKRRPGRPRKYPIFTEAELIAKQYAASTGVVNNGGVNLNKSPKFEPLFTPVQSVLGDLGHPDAYATEDELSKQSITTSGDMEKFSTGLKRKRTRTLSSGDVTNEEDLMQSQKLQKVAEIIGEVTKADESQSGKMWELCKRFDIKKELGVRLIKLDNSVPKISLRVKRGRRRKSAESASPVNAAVDPPKVEERVKRKPKPRVSFEEYQRTHTPLREPLKTVIRLNLKNKIESKQEKNRLEAELEKNRLEAELEKSRLEAKEEASKPESKQERNNNSIKDVEKCADASVEVPTQASTENDIVEKPATVDAAATLATATDTVYEQGQCSEEAETQQQVAEVDAPTSKASTSKSAIEKEISEFLVFDDNPKRVSETPSAVTPRRTTTDRTEMDESQKAKLLMLMNATTPLYETLAAAGGKPTGVVAEQSPQQQQQQQQQQQPQLQTSPIVLAPTPQQFCILFIPDTMYNSETGAINRDVTPTATLVNFQPVPDNEIANKSLIYTPTTPIKISTDEHAKSYVCGPCNQVLDLIGRLEASLGMTEEDKSAIKCPFCSNHFQSLFYLEYHVMQEHLKCENERQCRHSRLNSLRIPSHEVAAESEIYITFALKCRSCYDVFASVLALNDHVMHKHRGLVRLKPSSPSQLLQQQQQQQPLAVALAAGGYVAKNGATRPPVLQCPSDCVCRIGIRSSDSPLQRQQMLKRCPNAMRRLEKIEPAAYEVYTCTLCQSTFLMKDEVVDHLMKMHEVACKFPCLTCLTSFRALQTQENHRCSEVTLQDLDKLLNIAILPGNVSGGGGGGSGGSGGGVNGKGGDGKFLEREDSSTDEYGSIKASAATELSPTSTTPKSSLSSYRNGYKRKNGETIAVISQFLSDPGPKRIKIANQGKMSKYRKRGCPNCNKRFAYRKSLYDHVIYEHILKGTTAEGPKKVAVNILKTLIDSRANGQRTAEELAEMLKTCTEEDEATLKNLMMLEKAEQENSSKEMDPAAEPIPIPIPIPITIVEPTPINSEYMQCSSCKVYFKHRNNLATGGKHKAPDNDSSKVEGLCENCEANSGPNTRLRAIVNGQHMAGTTTETESTEPLITQTFICKKCSETFPTSVELKAHKRVVHLKIIEKLHSCEICTKTFSSLRMLEKHKKQHRESALDSSAKSQDDTDLSINGKVDAAGERGKNGEVNDSLKNANNSSRRDSSDSSSGRSKEPEEQPLHCSFCEELCSSKVSLKNHLKREHGRRASICQFCNGLLIDTSEVRHMLDYHIVPTKATPRRPIVKNNGCILQGDEASCMQEDVHELVRTLGKHRLQSLMMYYDFEGKCNNAIMRCPICPELFATRESCRFHYVWIHDNTCLLCDETFRSGSSAFQHKVDAHTSTASYLWCIQRLVTAIVNTLRLDPDQPSHVIYEMIVMRLEGLTNGVESPGSESSRSNAEKTGTEQAVLTPTAAERFLEEVVLSEDQLPDSSNMIEVVIGKDDSEDDLLSMLNLSPNYENHDQHGLPDADAAPPEEEEYEEETSSVPIVAVAAPSMPSLAPAVLSTTMAPPSALPASPLVTAATTTTTMMMTPPPATNTTTTVPALSVPCTSGIPSIENYVSSGVCKYRLENDEEQYVLVVTDEDLATFRDDIYGLAEKISSTCDSLTLEEITEMLRAYFEGMNASALGATYSSPR